MFVGQRKDVCHCARQSVRLAEPQPLAASGGVDDLADKNVTSIILEVEASCLTAGGDPVIGGWTTASLRQGRLLNGSPTSGHSVTAREGGAWVQVSRLGMPLVNEVVIGLKDKDKFNTSKPKDDGQFADYVTNPTFPDCRRFCYAEGLRAPQFSRQTCDCFVTAFRDDNPSPSRPPRCGA